VLVWQMDTSCFHCERLARARAHYRYCELCEHRCGVDRLAGQRGSCKAGPIARIYKHGVEYGEELELVPCHLFYLAGCDLRCVFCIGELDAFDPARGQELTWDLFNSAIEQSAVQGVRTIQWVGGEPTIHLPAILDVMSQCQKLPRVVWKSDFHATPEAFELLDGLVDVYVADFKFGNDVCAKQLSGCDDYCRILTRNLAIAAGQGRLIVRHLLLPGHFECCYRPIVQWLRDNLPGALLSIRESYLPKWRATEFGTLAGPVTIGSGRQAKRLASENGVTVIQ
jgi:putative pyruvate formate lyase activating enzyme